MFQELKIEVTFGDCDPAGIVFYPNAFRWMDAAFHMQLHRLGGHADLCRKLNIIGIGLVDAQVQFQKPMRDGDRLSLRIADIEWTCRTLTIHYEGQVGSILRFKGREVRCLFMQTEDGIVASEMAPIRQLLEQMNE